jgi:CRISPR system Cascade subunit CasC
VLGLYKDHGQPMQLVNAFEKPVWSKQGLIEKSVDELKVHHAAMKKTWNIETTTEVAMPDVDLKTFCERLTAHVI